MEPYTNIVCPDCGQHTRVKCELGNYRLVGRHAVGGMSKLFVARDATLDREVAIKILNDEYCHDAERMKQFEHEALITAAISHPHVVRVFTVGKAYRHFYIAMELVPGESLEQRMAREGPISEDKMLPLCAEIISGLKAARDAGLIHRDIKPGNILFDANDHVKIVDFGLALVTQGGVATAEEVWATPYYVPPEALVGEQEDFRSDMYALGATLYHALSGKPSIPEQSQSSSLIIKRKANVEPLSKTAPWLKPETCQFVEKAMAFERKNRFGSYGEMGDTLAHAIHVIEEVGADDPIYCSERDQRRKRDKVMVTVLVAFGLIALVTILGLVVFKNKGGNEQQGTGAEEVMNFNAAMLGDDDDYSPELAARIGKMFRQSHQHLQEGRYLQAKTIFEKLMNDKDVAEPTASWAGVEAVIAAWLAGDGQQAEAASAALSQHIQKRKLSGNRSVVELAKQISGYGAISKVKKLDENMAVLQLMAAALKNWEIGEWDLAIPIFKKVERVDLPDQSPLLVYHELARKYLGDYDRLKSLAPLSPSADAKQVGIHQNMLKKTAKDLETKGRSGFHIQVWQTRAQRYLKELERLEKEAQQKAREEKAKALSYQEQMAQFRRLVSASKFGEAQQLLAKVTPPQGDRARKDAWQYLVKSASAFIRDLVKELAKGVVEIEVLSVNGDSYEMIVSATPDGLKLKNDTREVFQPWSNIDPDSLLNVYRKVFELNLETLDGQRLTEHAICYAWLMGLSEKAELAVSDLSEVSSNFEKRWPEIMDALEKTSFKRN